MKRNNMLLVLMMVLAPGCSNTDPEAIKILNEVEAQLNQTQYTINQNVPGGNWWGGNQV